MKGVRDKNMANITKTKNGTKVKKLLKSEYNEMKQQIKMCQK